MTRLACLTLVALGAVAAALSPVSAVQLFRTSVDAVTVDVLVTRDGRPVAGLTADDFELRDNGLRQEIRAVRLEDVPLTLMLVLDVSQSVTGEPLAQLRSAIDAAARALSTNDRLMLFTFSHHVALLTSATGDRQQVHAAAVTVEATGATSLYDATMAALVMRQRIDGRVVMLVFSDGDDTASWSDPRDVLTAAQRSDVVVYGVSLRRSTRDGPDAFRLDRAERRWFHDDPASFGRQYLPLLTADTGGALLTAERTEALHETFTRVVREFKSRYVLLYTPRDVEAAGWHAIDVRLKRQQATVTARRGYLRGTR